MLADKQKKEYVLVMVNMFLFHAHILLRKTDDRKLISQEEKQQLKEFFFSMLQAEKEYLPAEFCLKVFFKYLMYKEAFLFLFYRGEYERLLTLIHDQYKQEKKEIEKLKERLAGKSAQTTATSKAKSPTPLTLEQSTALSEEIDQRMNLQSFWITNLQKYCRKINSNYEGS